MGGSATDGRLAELRSRVTGLAPTLWVLLVVLVTFAGQRVAATAADMSVGRATALFFVNYPAIAWPLSPLLHNNVAHLFTNVGLLAIVGIEAQRHLSDRAYAWLFVVATVVSLAVGVATRLPFTDGAFGVLGISGFVFALATYLAFHYRLSHRTSARPTERPDFPPGTLTITAVSLGLAATLLVSLDVGRAALNGFEGINGGHLGGALVGVAAAYVQGRRSDACDGRDDEGEQPTSDES